MKTMKEIFEKIVTLSASTPCPICGGKLKKVKGTVRLASNNNFLECDTCYSSFNVGGKFETK